MPSGALCRISATNNFRVIGVEVVFSLSKASWSRDALISSEKVWGVLNSESESVHYISSERIRFVRENQNLCIIYRQFVMDDLCLDVP